MNEDQARAFVVRELGMHRDRDDILLVLCRELNIDWSRAEQFVSDVELQYGQRIARKQSPLLMVIGLGVILAGLALTTYGVWEIFEFVQMETAQQLVYSQYMYFVGASMITGLAMIVGGIIGFRRIFSAILN